MEYTLPDSRYEVVEEYISMDGQVVIVNVINNENGFQFSIAKDSTGTQICNDDGLFYVDARDFGTIENAIKFLCEDNNLEKAEEFFTNNSADFDESLFNVMVGSAYNNELEDEDEHF